jgi:hypothetical protein
MCLVSSLAMVEMQQVLSVLLQRWRLALKAGSPIDRGSLMVSQAKRGPPVVLGRMRESPDLRKRRRAGGSGVATPKKSLCDVLWKHGRRVQRRLEIP